MLSLDFFQLKPNEDIAIIQGYTSPLQQEQVHIWQLEWESASQTNLEQNLLFLSPLERRRAEEFYFEKDKNCYILSCSFLRKIISLYARIDPMQIQFTLGQYKKPYLAKSNLKFNLSHSNKIILYAFTLENDVGIDIEYMRSIDSESMLDIAKSIFSTMEFQEFNRLLGQQKIEYFFRTWTRKEAYLKALGMGMHGSLETIESQVSFTQNNRFYGIIWNRDFPHPSRYVEFDPAAQYVATVVLI